LKELLTARRSSHSSYRYAGCPPEQQHTPAGNRS
jgi:hypothetical protein